MPYYVDISEITLAKISLQLLFPKQLVDTLKNYIIILVVERKKYFNVCSKSNKIFEILLIC